MAVRQPLDRQRILGPHVDVAVVGADRVGGQRHALDHAMRIRLQHGPVHERAGIAFVGIADHIFLLARHLGHGRPFQTGRIAAAAAAAQAAA